MRKIKFGIIGFGRIGQKHKEKIEENTNCELIAICDTDPNMLNKITDKTIILFQNYKELLNRKDIEVVSICTPNFLHAPMTITALNAGKHVLCEKPMALSSADCREMINTAQKNDKKLFIVKQNRYNPPVQAVKKLIDENKLGIVVCLQSFQ